MQLDAGSGIAIPATALTEPIGQPAVWVVDLTSSDGVAAQHRGRALRPGQGGIAHGLDPDEIVVTAGTQALIPARSPGHRNRRGERLQSFRLGARASLLPLLHDRVDSRGACLLLPPRRNEDPAFTFRTMVVQAEWPGATLDDTLLQVTERLERKLQEVPHLDFLRSYTKRRVTTIFVNLQGRHPARRGARHLVPGPQEGRRHPPYPAGGHRRTRLQRRVRRHLRDHLRLHRRRLHAPRVARLCRRVRSRLLRVPDVSKIEILGAQDERIFVEFSTDKLAGLGHRPRS